jgi:Spy/CpxP family protein refolding chaperone
VELEQPEELAVQAQQVHKEYKVMWDQLDLLVAQAQQVELVGQEQPVELEQQVARAVQEQQVHKEYKEMWDQLDLLVAQAQRVELVRQVEPVVQVK